MTEPTQSGLAADLYRALRDYDPLAFEFSGWVPTQTRWILTKDMVRQIAAMQGEVIPDDYDWSQAGGLLLGCPFRVVEDAEMPYALERAPRTSNPTGRAVGSWPET